MESRHDKQNRSLGRFIMAASVLIFAAGVCALGASGLAAESMNALFVLGGLCGGGVAIGLFVGV